MLSVIQNVFEKFRKEKQNEHVQRDPLPPLSALPDSVVSLILARLPDRSLADLVLTSPSIAGVCVRASPSQHCRSQTDLVRLGWLIHRRSEFFPRDLTSTGGANRFDLELNSPSLLPLAALSATEARGLMELERLRIEVDRVGPALCHAAYPLSVRPGIDENLCAIRSLQALRPLVRSLVLNGSHGVRLPVPGSCVAAARTLHGAGFRTLARPDIGKNEAYSDLHLFERPGRADDDDIPTSQWLLLLPSLRGALPRLQTLTLTADGRSLTVPILRALLEQAPPSLALHLALRVPSEGHLLALAQARAPLRSLTLTGVRYEKVFAELHALAPLAPGLTALDLDRMPLDPIDAGPIRLEAAAAALSGLRELSICRATLDLDFVESLARLPQLASLNCFRCKFVDRGDLLLLLPSLRSLGLDATVGLLAILPNLTQLTALRLNFSTLVPTLNLGRYVSYYLLQYAARLEGLRSLSLSACCFDGLLAWHFRRKFNALEMLHIDGFQEEDLPYAHRHVYKRLAGMHRTGIAVLMAYARKKPALRVLSLSNTELALSSFHDLRSRGTAGPGMGELRVLRLHRCWTRHPTFYQATISKLFTEARSVRVLDLIDCFRDEDGAAQYLVSSANGLRAHLERTRPDMAVRIAG